MRNLFIEKYADRIQVKSNGRYYYYYNGKRLEYKETDRDIILVLGRLLNFMKKSTNKGKDETGFLHSEYKKFFEKNYNFSHFYCINRQFINDINNLDNLFYKGKVLKDVKKPLYYYDISNCYPTLFLLSTKNYEIYEMLNNLPKEKRLKALGSIAYRETIFEKINGEFELTKENEFGSKYYYLFTTLINILNEINKAVINSEFKNNILYTYCDAFVCNGDFGDYFVVNFNNDKVLYKKKGEYFFNKAKEDKNYVYFEIFNEKNTKIHTLSKIQSLFF